MNERAPDRQMIASHEAEGRLRKIIEQVMEDRTDIIRKAIRTELDDWGMRIGLNTADPVKQQEDFRHLRRWRQIVESSGMRAAVSAVSLLVAAFLGLLWFALTEGWRR